MRIIIYIWIFHIYIFNVCGQKELVYSQENSTFFTNKYYFNTSTKTFKHEFATDDGQLWYGSGSYVVRKRKIVLSFKDSDRQLNTNFYYCNEKNKFLTVFFFDRKDNKISVFVKYNDKYYYPDFEKIIKIEKKEFKEDYSPVIKIIHNGKEYDIELKKIKELDTLEIKGVIDKKIIHFETNFVRELRYKKNKIISLDFYNTTKNKKVKFFCSSPIFISL